MFGDTEDNFRLSKKKSTKIRLKSILGRKDVRSRLEQMAWRHG